MEYFKIGKIVASYGLKGELIIVHTLGNKTSLKGLEKIFVEVSKENLLPYFIESCSAKADNEVLLKLEGFETKESLKKLLTRNAWITEADFHQYAAKSGPAAMLGFQIVENNIELGEIIEVLEQPHQILCTIIYKGNEALIPIHSESLIKVDQKLKQVHVQLPHGLLELYASQ